MSHQILVDILKNKGLKLATAESCTGGMIAALITEISGSSAVFEGCFVTYSNAMKTKLLGVDEKLLEVHGAVSEEVAKAMVQGALAKTGADIAVSVTGIAGPTGGSADKPVGLVYIAVATKNNIVCDKKLFTGDREQVRKSAVVHAIAMLQRAVA